VIRINMRQSNGGMDWDTDKLFATQNRTDLVGQPIISTNPGEGGNVILVGHNYDNGVFQWEGVFVRIKDLRPGDEIQIYTADGALHRYQVKQVRKVPWSSGSADELAKHLKFLGPQPSETLTLVTCNGATIGIWNSRIYVQAAPVQ
jgi:sortase (surface protein transpeptidase)